MGGEPGLDKSFPVKTDGMPNSFYQLFDLQRAMLAGANVPNPGAERSADAWHP